MRLCGCGPRSLKGVMDPSNPTQDISAGHFNRANTNAPVNKPIIPNSVSDSNKYEQIPEKDVDIVNTMLESSGTPSNKSSRRFKEQPQHDSLKHNLNESDESRNPESLEISTRNKILQPSNVARSIELNHPSSKQGSPDKVVSSEDNEVEKVTINDTFAADIVFAGADFYALKKSFEDRAPTENHTIFMNELADIESNVNQLFIDLDRIESPELLNKTQSISSDPCKPKLNELRQEIISFKETLQEYDSFIKSVQAGSVYSECFQRMKQQSNTVKVEVEAYNSDKDMDHLKLALATLAEVKESRELITEFLNDKHLKENVPKIMIQPKEIDENINDWVNKIQFEIDERTRSKECSDNPVEEYTSGLGLIADNFFPSIEKRIEVFNQPVEQPVKRTVPKEDIETSSNFQELRDLLEKRIKQNTESIAINIP